MRAYAAAAILGVLALAFGAEAAEVKVLCAAGASTAMRALAAPFERDSGHKLVVTFVAGPVVKTAIDKDGPYDLAISQPETIDAMLGEARILRPSRRDLMRTGLGIAAKAGSAPQDIATAEGLKRVLLAVRSFGYSKEGSSAAILMTVLDGLQVRSAIEPKLVPLEPAQLLQAVTDSRADIALSSIPSIRASGDLMLLGPLPPELDVQVVFTGGIVADGPQHEAAQSFMTYLVSADAVQRLRAAGYEPIVP